jgi:hypothetical protein
MGDCVWAKPRACPARELRGSGIDRETCLTTEFLLLYLVVYRAVSGFRLLNSCFWLLTSRSLLAAYGILRFNSSKKTCFQFAFIVFIRG